MITARNGACFFINTHDVGSCNICRYYISTTINLCHAYYASQTTSRQSLISLFNSTTADTVAAFTKI